MRIAQIEITELFGMFNHTIPLNLDERVTIIHGPNGYGKTMLLRMIHALASKGKSTQIAPFEQFIITWTDGHLLTVNGGYFSEDEATSFSCTFIDIDRLTEIDVDPSQKAPVTKAMVNVYAKQLKKALGEILADYANLSQKLDQSFPIRLVKNGKSKATREEIKSKLTDLASQRHTLVAVGLLEPEDQNTVLQSDDIDESNLPTLQIYIADTEQKLAVFSGFAEKLTLFKSIINRRFLHKQIGISQEEGLVLTTANGQTLPLEKLSSGEQQELILFYRLLFQVEKDTLILIDEPELSLHVAWQKQFLEDLQEVTRLAQIDVLIATHSPQIINDRWDLTVELKGPGAA